MASGASSRLADGGKSALDAGVYGDRSNRQSRELSDKSTAETVQENSVTSEISKTKDLNIVRSVTDSVDESVKGVLT